MSNGIGRKTLYPGGLTKVRGEVKAVYPVTGSKIINLENAQTVALSLTTKGAENLILILVKALRMAGGKTITITGHRFKDTVTVTTPK